jgi:hypothetical protein
MTAGEMAYFKSGGADVSGLDLGEGSQEPAGGQQQQPSNGGGQQPNGQQAAPDGQGEGDGDEDGEEVVVLGKDGKPRAQNGRFVPHQALHKEREQHKLTKAELTNVRERQARADERLNVLNEILGAAEKTGADNQQQNAPRKSALEGIDAVSDPLKALETALSEIKRLEGEMNGNKTQQQERESARSMQSAYQNDAVRYLQEKPEFKDAYQYLIGQRHAELEAMGVSDANERNRLVAQEERGIVQSAFQSRKSPAQMLHNLAVARGFKHVAPQQQQNPQQDAVRKIEAIAAGQKNAGASLSNAGGSSGEGLTAAALADMSEEEFASVAAKLGKTKLRQLLGG